MPTGRTRDYAIQAGTQTVASFNSTHIIENFSLETDQGAVQWFAPDFFKSAIPERQAYNTMLDFSIVGDGMYQFRWVFTYHTNDMLESWSDTYMNSGDPSGSVTVRTYDKYDNAVYLTCTIVDPLQSNNAVSPAQGGWFDVTYQFIGGAIIT